MLRKYLDALARYDTPSSLDAYTAHISDSPDNNILFDYILLQKSNGNFVAALDATRTLLAVSRDPLHRLCECDLLAGTGQDAKALAAYEQLIRDELAAKNDLEGLRSIISRYRQFLKKLPDSHAAQKRFLELVSTDVNVASLLETARYYQDAGEMGEARSWYYRAYRADFLAGGLEYARFLSTQGENRECEKVMLYILANAKKASDITRVAAAIVDEKGRMHSLKRLMEQLIKRLEERRFALSSDGLELLAMAFFITATNALEEMDYAGCKHLCLSGMDILPTPTRALRLEDFLQLIQACKERSITDRPIMHSRPVTKSAETIPASTVIMDLPGLSEQEQKVMEFLRTHRKASEMELRKVLGTRRVVGIVNILLQKAAAQGISLIEKKGVGEEGEIYEYLGT
jgi:tetratricopeptide (TPR) repeat protein